MIDMQNQEEIPILEDFEAYIRNAVIYAILLRD